MNWRIGKTCTPLFLVLVMLSGCASFKTASSEPAIISQIPDEFARAVPQGDYAPVRWWTAFGDPALNRLLDEALDGNLSLQEAAARLKAAEARARLSKSGLFPQVNASASASYSNSPLGGSAFGDFVPGGGPGGGPTRLENETYNPGLGFAYEVDIWGRIRNDLRSARADALAAAADLQAVRLSIMAETITAYFDLVDARHQIALSTKIIDVLGDRLERTEDRYRRGLASSFELYQVRQEFRNIQASLPQRETRLAAIEGQIAVLAGRYASNIKPLIDGKLQPKLIFEPIPGGLPIDLLAQRPDVYAEGLRLEAARFNVKARKAERFPALSLSTNAGTQADNVPGVFDVFDNWVLNLGASLTAPIFQGGRIKANVDIADAQYAQQAALYARTVLTAYQEVGVAMERYEEERQRYRFLFSQQQEAEAAANLQSRRFAGGVGSYTDFLDALRARYQVQSAISSAGRDVALARLAVHRALGGSWDLPKGPSGQGPSDTIDNMADAAKTVATETAADEGQEQ